MHYSRLVLGVTYKCCLMLQLPQTVKKLTGFSLLQYVDSYKRSLVCGAPFLKRKRSVQSLSRKDMHGFNWVYFMTCYELYSVRASVKMIIALR